MKKNEFTTYDYATINVKKNKESIYIDTYESFGWELTDSEINSANNGFINTKLSFKRNRKINNKSALIKLQKKLDVHFQNIDSLEAKKTINASFKAYGIGILAIIFLALSVFIITDYIDLGNLSIPLQIIFGAIGILLTIPPYFVYQNTVTLKTEQLQPQIDQEYDEISNICEEANLLLQD